MNPKYGLQYALKVLTTFKELFGGAAVIVMLGSVYEHYYGTSISWQGYLVLAVVCIVFALFRDGLDSYRRLLPELNIEPKVHLQSWTAGGKLCHCYYLEVRNRSEGRTIHNVTVKLTKIEPEVENLNWLPVNLHLKHDNAPPGAVAFVNAKDFDLHPGDVPQHVDLVAAAVGADTITVEHITQGVNKSIPSRNKYRLTVVASGTDAKQSTAIFQVWTDDQGTLRCLPL